MKQSIRDKLEHLANRLEELDRTLASEDGARDMNVFRELSRERAEIEPVVALYREHRQAEADCATFDCLILDLHMPGITGVELQGQLRAAGHASPIIFLTGAGDIPTSVSAMKAGAVDFLTKPVDDIALSELTRTLARYDLRALAVEPPSLEELFLHAYSDAAGRE